MLKERPLGSLRVVRFGNHYDPVHVQAQVRPIRSRGPYCETNSFLARLGPLFKEFSYDIRARWTENGQQVDRHRKVTFHAGDRLMVNLMAPQGKAHQPKPGSKTAGNWL